MIPYYPQANGVMERNNRTLGDALHALLLDRDSLELYRLLPHIMHTMRVTPNSGTGETVNYRELRLPDELSGHPPPLPPDSTTKYALDRDEELRSAHLASQIRQLQIREEDQEEPLLYTTRDRVWVFNMH